MSYGTVAVARLRYIILQQIDPTSSEPAFATASLQAMLDSADIEIRGAFRKHYDVDDAAFGADEFIVDLSNRLGAAMALDSVASQMGQKSTLADEMKDYVAAEAEKCAQGKRTLSILRRSDNPEGGGYPASSCSTAAVTPQFSPTTGSMTQF